MINLLPPESKHQIRAARVNVVLRVYCVLLILDGLGLGGIFGVGWWVTSNDKAAAVTAKAASQQSASQYSVTRKAADDFAKNLSIDKTILASNVSFSTLLTDIAAIVPHNVILNNLSLSAAVATAPVDISARAKSSEDAVILKNSLEASPIFEQVNITNINQADPNTLSQSDDVTKKYPFTINLKVQFTKTTPAPKGGNAGS